MTIGNNHHIRNRTIRRISADTISDMDKLYQRVYQKKPATDYYKHKLATAFAGLAYGGFIAYSEKNEPIASLCIITCFISDQGKKIPAAQLTDGMTDPEHRGSGLFGELSEAVIGLATDVGIHVIFGFPNQNAHPILVNNGWDEAERLDRFEIPVKRSFRWLIGRINKNSKMDFAERTGCNNSVLKDGFAGIDRSQEYLMYKSFTGTGIIKAGKTKAWIKADHDIAIGDMETNENNIDEMIAAVSAIAVKTGAGKIHFQCSKGISLHQLFFKKYPALPSFPVVFKKINDNVQTDRIRFTFADIDIF